jgi:hypothetical protein
VGFEFLPRAAVGWILHVPPLDGFRIESCLAHFDESELDERYIAQLFVAFRVLS